jgi:hypothetical protein
VTTPSKPWTLRATLLVGVPAILYFVMFPQDLGPVLAPPEKILALSGAVSPGLYAVIGVGILCATIIRVWGGREAPNQKLPPT